MYSFSLLDFDKRELIWYFRSKLIKSQLEEELKGVVRKTYKWSAMSQTHFSMKIVVRKPYGCGGLHSLALDWIWLIIQCVPINMGTQLTNSPVLAILPLCLPANSSVTALFSSTGFGVVLWMFLFEIMGIAEASIAKVGNSFVIFFTQSHAKMRNFF